MHGMLILLWIEDLAKTASDSDFIINTNWQWKRGNAWCWTLSHVYFGNFGRGAILIMSVLLFYITYGWRGLIFCFQKRLLQSKIFQARFRAFEVLLLRSFLYKRLSTINFGNSSQKHCVIAFLKVLPKPLTWFWGQLFLYSENWKTKSKEIAKLVAGLISERKSLYSFEPPLIFK